MRIGSKIKSMLLLTFIVLAVMTTFSACTDNSANGEDTPSITSQNSSNEEVIENEETIIVDEESGEKTGYVYETEAGQ